MIFGEGEFEFEADFVGDHDSFGVEVGVPADPQSLRLVRRPPSSPARVGSEGVLGDSGEFKFSHGGWCCVVGCP